MFFILVQVILICFLSFIPWPAPSVFKISCSRDSARVVRKIVQSRWLPILEKYQVCHSNQFFDQSTRQLCLCERSRFCSQVKVIISFFFSDNFFHCFFSSSSKSKTKLTKNFNQNSPIGQIAIRMSIPSVARNICAATSGQNTKSPKSMDVQFVWQKFFRGKILRYAFWCATQFGHQHSRRCRLPIKLLRYNAMQSAAIERFNAIFWRIDNINGRWTLERGDGISHINECYWTKISSQTTK